MSNPSDYTIGWICAITTEYVAAQTFLDEKHEGPKYISVNDNNDYTLGRIGRHNVVIAVLPAGEYGLVSAATVATHMMHTFPNLRIGLMVGIGGGAPSLKHDIRLGDIVVSTPGNSQGGVLQHDFGKTIQDQTFRMTGLLNHPPVILRTAVSALKAQYEIDGHQIEEAINDVIRKKPRLRGKYKRPGPETDRLYLSHVVHPLNEESRCEISCGNDMSCLRLRTERTEDEDNPTIHYGLIASANQLMKDALIRDKLAAEKKDVQAKVSDMSTKIDIIIQDKHDGEQTKVLEWLATVDYTPQQINYIKRRQPGTGQWFLDSTEYKTWLGIRGQTLFCPGIPRAGKTIIAATVIDGLYTRFQDDAVGIAYVYLDYRRQQEQKIEDVLANILKQLVQRQASIPDCVQALYCQYKSQPKRPSIHEFSNALHSISALYSKMYIIVDALDESPATDGCRTTLLSEISKLQAKQQVNCLATSRFIPEIMEKFKEDTLFEIIARDDDVQTYLAAHMTLMQAREPTVGHNELALQNLPAGLHTTYEQVMMRIESQGGGLRDLAKKVLSWVVFAKRVLSLAELQHAVAVEPGKTELNSKFIPRPDIIRSICAGLVVIDINGDAVRLVHYTAQEYFELTRDRWFPDVESDIATVCVTYLSFKVFTTGYCETNDEFEQRLQLNKLYDYAAQNWGHHVRVSSLDGNESVSDLLGSDTRVSACSQAIMADLDRGISHLHMTGVHIAAYFGLVKSMVVLVSQEQYPDSKDKNGRTPLSYAVENGDETVMRLLLDNGVDPDSGGSLGFNPLTLLMQRGFKVASKLLLDNRADPNGSISGLRPLHYAIVYKREAIVRLLLERGTDPNAQDLNRHLQKPLTMAVTSGEDSIMQMMLEKGADPNFKDTFGRTALLFAAEEKFTTAVKLLLDKGADPNPRDKYGLTALRHAAGKGYEKVTELLLNNGADPDIQDDTGATPLMWAAYGGYYTIVEQLLNRGVDPNLRSKEGAAPLLFAAIRRHHTIIELLLDKGADPNIETNEGSTPLSYAVRNERAPVVKLLVDKGAGTSCLDDHLATQLSQMMQKQNPS